MLFANRIFSQETIQAEKESLAQITLGEKPTQIAYLVNDEGFLSPGSPFVDSSGRVFFYKTLNGKYFLYYDHGKIGALPYQGNLDAIRVNGNREINSQQGILLDGLSQLVLKENKIYEINYKNKDISISGYGFENYAMPFGALLYSAKEKSGIAILFNLNKPEEDFTIIEQNSLNSWLVSQPGGFKIGEDGLVYRNGIIWSAVRPNDSSEGTRFLGRLISGHLVWIGTQQNQEQYIIISTPQGTTELKVEIPWGEIIKNPYTCIILG
jgi:hypothetical protein